MNDLELHSLEIPSVEIVYFLTFSPDGNFFVTGGDGSDTAFIFNTENPGKKIELKPPDEEPHSSYTYPTSASFSPKTDQVCVGYRNGLVRLWDFNEMSIGQTLKNPKRTIRMETKPEETHVSFFPQGEDILLGSDTKLFIYSITEDEMFLINNCLHSKLISVCVSKCGNLYCAGFDYFASSDNHYGQIFVTLLTDTKDITVLDFKDPLAVLTMSPNSNYICAGGVHGKLLIYNVVSKQETYLYNQNHEITSVAFTPDEECICTCNYSNGLIFWNVKTGERIIRITEVDFANYYSNRCCAFSLDAKYLILAGFNKITINLNPMAYWTPSGHIEYVKANEKNEANLISSVQRNIMAFFLSNSSFKTGLPIMANIKIFEHLKYYQLIQNNPRFTFE
jgi:WD40 repeat protein